MLPADRANSQTASLIGDEVRCSSSEAISRVSGAERVDIRLQEGDLDFLRSERILIFSRLGDCRLPPTSATFNNASAIIDRRNLSVAPQSHIALPLLACLSHSYPRSRLHGTP